LASWSWKTISAEDYRLAFERFGGSFAVHPRVVALVSSLAERPVRYRGLTCGADIVAAAPLWGEHIVATRLALETYGASGSIDVGDSEVVLPVADGVRVEMPFEAPMLSSLHAENISNLERDMCPYPGRETISFLALAKGLQAGSCRQTGKSQKRRRLQIQRFRERGGGFHPLCDFSADELAAIYRRLYRKRWGEGSFLLGDDNLPVVFRELKDMLFGDMLFFDDRPVALELVYKHATPRWLFANGVQAGFDPEFSDHSVGSILLYHNLEQLEKEAIASDKSLRYSLGWSDAPYKALWTFEEPAYRLRAAESREEPTIAPNAPPLVSAEAQQSLRGGADASSESSFWRVPRPAHRMAATVSSGLRLQAARAAKALHGIAAPHRMQERIDALRSRRAQTLATQAVEAPDLSREAAAGMIIEEDRSPKADDPWSIAGNRND
jgi:hypothetical protein